MSQERWKIIADRQDEIGIGSPDKESLYAKVETNGRKFRINISTKNHEIAIGYSDYPPDDTKELRIDTIMKIIPFMNTLYSTQAKYDFLSIVMNVIDDAEDNYTQMRQGYITPYSAKGEEEELVKYAPNNDW